jgi:hypothetical protein
MAANSPDVGLTQIASSKAIGVWLNTSIDAPKGIARVLLEGFWQRATHIMEINNVPSIAI